MHSFLVRTKGSCCYFYGICENQELTAYNTYIDIGKQLVGIARPSCMIPQYIRPER